VFVLALAAYAFHVHRSIPAGDSGELIAVAHGLGTAHPPGYPLWTLLAAAWERLVPIGGVVFRLNLFSAVTAALAAAVLARTVETLPGGPRAWSVRTAAGYVAGLALAFAPPFWKNALVAEVFALNALLAAAALRAFGALLRARDEGRATARPFAALGLVGGLLVAHHHSLVLLWLPLAIAAAVRAGSRRGLAAAAVALAVGLTPLLYLPLAAGRTPPPAISWGEPATPGGFLRILTRADYGTFQLDPKEAGLVADRSHVLLWLESIPRDFRAWGAALALLGALALARDPRRRPLALALAAFAVLQAAFFTRVGFPTEPAVFLGVVERFYVLPAVVLALLVGAGAGAALAWIARRTVPHAAPAQAAAVVLAVAFVGVLDPVRTAAIRQDRNTLIADLADGVLASVPDSAVLFVQGDVFHNALAVRQGVEGARPDVTVLDQELLTYPWSVAHVRRRHPGVLPARLGAHDRYDGSPGSGNLAWLDHLAGRRPAAFLGLKEPSYDKRWTMQPVGFVLHAVPRGRSVDPAEVAARGLAVVGRVRFDGAFRTWDPTSFEALERARLTECLARTTRDLCRPEAFALTPEATPGFAELLAALERSRAAAESDGPPEDPELVRARGTLYALHPAVRDSARAAADLGSLRQKPVAAAGAPPP
jgi:hypothetical protein